MRRLGQHFLKNESIVKKIIDALRISPGEKIIEIGPGHGELTIPLLDACTVAGVKLSVIEKDERLAATLTSALKDNADIITADALEALGGMLSREQGGTTKLVGNLPYYITGKLLRIVSEAGQKPERCVFMVQHEVAERICARPPHMNRLAASVQFWADPKIVVTVPRNDFSPPPEVESAVILLERKKTAPMEADEKYYRTVRAIFSQPRKTLGNNIATELKKSGVLKEKALAKISELGKDITPSLRPQDLSVEQIALIAKTLF